MDILTLDFETYYEKTGYTLKKLTYLEYMKDPRFKIHGCGFKLNDDEPVWITDPIDIQAYLDEMGTDVIALGHNMPFDGMILHLFFDWHPDVYADTLAMSNGMFVGRSAGLDRLTKRLFPNDPSLHKGTELSDFAGKRDLTPEESRILGGYCKQDLHITYAAYKAMEPHYPDKELDLISLTTRMFCEPILEIDQELVEDNLKAKEDERNAAIKAAGIAESTLSSNVRFQAWIEKQGIEVPMKESMKQGPNNTKIVTETFAGGKNDLGFQLMARNNPEHQHVWDGRIAAKSTGEISRSKRFLQIAELANGQMPVPLKYYGAHTGRYGGMQKVNLQNLGRKSKLRRALRAPKNHLVYVADSSQIEARMNAWHAGQDDLVEQFRNGDDIYSIFAGENVYHMPVNKDDNPMERFVGKVAILGLGYNMGAPKFRTTLAVGAMGPQVFIDEQEAYSVVNAYRTRYNMIARSWTIAQNVLVKMLTPKIDEQWGPLHILPGMLVLPNGMTLQYNGLRVSEEDPRNGNLSFEYYNGQYWKNIYGGLLIENIIQALARIVLFEQMLDVDAYAKPFGGRAVLNVHDEIIVVAPDFGAYDTGKVEEIDGKKKPIWANTSEADEFFDGLQNLMRQPLDWCPDLPLDCEGGYDYVYSK